MTYLFRKTFTFSGNPNGASISLDHVVDDGVSYYLNGVWIGSSRHTPAQWDNAASVAVGDAVEELNAISRPATSLVNGTNVLTAEVHQSNVGSSDVVFAARVRVYAAPVNSDEWRIQNFGSMNNTGNAADLADPDGDQLPNISEFMLMQNPSQRSSNWVTTTISGSNLVLTYKRRKSALSEVNVSYLGAASPNGPWTAATVTETILSDDGITQNVRAQSSIASTQRRFVKLHFQRNSVVPSAPGGGSASSSSSTQVNLNWTDNSNNETGFRIERKTTAGGTYAQIATVGANTTSWQDTTVSGGTTYYYRIRANNLAGDSSYTAEFSLTTPVTATPQEMEIVYFEYQPDANDFDDQQIKLKAMRQPDGKIYLTDEAGDDGYTHYYTINGSVNRVDARQLSQNPVPSRRWIHLVKFVTSVTNINTDGWKTSAQYYGSNPAYGAVYELTFWIKDPSQPINPILPYTQPLWPNRNAVGDLGLFDQTQFTLPSYKKYGSESGFSNETNQSLERVGWNTSNDKFRLLYEAAVNGLMNHMGASFPNGITTFNNEQLDQAADWLAGYTPASTFAVDFEPGNPAADSWKWDYSSPNFRQTMYSLSSKIYARHGKRFYSWIGEAVTFTANGKSFVFSGGAYDSWRSISGSGTTIDDYLAVHSNPASVQNLSVPYPNILQIGFGYTSMTINNEDSRNETADKWLATNNWYLRSLDLLNLNSLLVPSNVKFLTFTWPYEDKPNDAKRSKTRRFQIGSGTQGWVRHIDNRVMYPMNLVRDGLFVHLCNPRVFYTNYWMFGSSYNPYNTLHYSRINGPACCRSATNGGYFVYEYNGPDNPACPTENADYIGKDNLGVAAMIQAHEIFADYQDILNGTQVRETAQFSYRRPGDAAYINAQWANDTGEFARAFKHRQPWVQIWRNPATGKKLLLFQDNFADAYEAISFRITINGSTITRTADGNNLFIESFLP